MQLLMRKNRSLKLFLLCVLTLFSIPQAKALESAHWQMLIDGEAVAIMRHALAPGNGDPTNFTLGVCETQRNLSEEGQIQAQEIGELFRSNGVTQADVFSSQWCRCVDTANGLDFGSTKELPILNSIYQDRSTEKYQTSALLAWLEARIGNPNVVRNSAAILVSHQVNITSLTGVYPSSGEIVIVGFEHDALVVLGTVEAQ